MTIADAPILDHLVLPTADLGTARERLATLGFTVAPEGVHPFGTRNACVYFADGGFLEPLAIGDAAAAADAARAGNVFVARDRAFRDLAGDEGFSALVLATDDADADHRNFVAAGISAGDRLDFSRGYRDAEGRERTVSFRLAFAAPPGERRSLFFTCQRVDAPAGGRGALAVHRNGVHGISRVIAVAENPSNCSPFLSAFARTGVDPHGDGITLRLSSASLDVMTAAGFEAATGIRPVAPSDALSFQAITFAVPDIARTVELLEAAGIEFRAHGGTIAVPPAPGQGAAFLFEELP